MSNVSDRRALVAIALAGAFVFGARQDALAQRERPARPAQMSWQAAATPAGEPGEPLVVSGTVYAADGTTPKAGAVVYAYQTDARGLYTPDGRPGVPRLHAFMRTDARGRYQMRTIRPASYPGQSVAPHIHIVVEVDGREQGAHFDVDPELTEEVRERLASQGRFAPVCRPERDASGTARCTRDIRLTP